MSKSLGNIIDPLDVIYGITITDLNKQLDSSNLDPKEVEKAKSGQREDYPNGIPECGTDALRFALCAYTAQGRDINLDVLRIQGYRHFCNKLWNATRFAMANGLGAEFTPRDTTAYLVESRAQLRPVDRWIMSRLSETVVVCSAGLKNFELTNATTALFNFWLYDLCDYYIEYLKPSFYAKEPTAEQQRQFENSREVLYTCLDAGLRLISPFMPFISEELYQRLPRRRPATDAPSITITPYPTAAEFDTFRNVEIEGEVKLAQEAINRIRSLRSDYQLTVKNKTDLFVQTFDASIERALSSLQDLLLTMTNGKSVAFLDGADGSQVPPVGCALSTLSDKCKLYLMLKGIIDIDKEEQKLSKKKETLQQQIEVIVKNQSKPGYDKVPEAVRQQNQEKVSFFFLYFIYCFRQLILIHFLNINIKLVQLTNEIQLIDDGIKQLQEMRSL
jgi:valyl-tRNA synthetase